MRFRPIPTTLLVVYFVMSSLCGCGRQPADLPRSEQPASEQEVIVEDVHFRHGDNLLTGSLYRPSLPGPHPAVALVLGSGEQDRNYGGAGPALGRHFARNGFACLTWDKPGVGQSTGDFNAQTFQDRAEEALAALRFLRERPDIRSDQVGLWGHSQGGAVVPLAASQSDSVSFIIQVSGWQGPAWRQDLARVEAELRADGSPEADIKAAVAFARLRMDMIVGAGPYEDLERAQEKVKDQPWFKAVHFCDRARFYSGRLTLRHDPELGESSLPGPRHLRRHGHLVGAAGRAGGHHPPRVGQGRERRRDRPDISRRGPLPVSGQEAGSARRSGIRTWLSRYDDWLVSPQGPRGLWSGAISGCATALSQPPDYGRRSPASPPSSRCPLHRAGAVGDAGAGRRERGAAWPTTSSASSGSHCEGAWTAR
jgi:dienelactone hydrolase